MIVTTPHEAARAPVREQCQYIRRRWSQCESQRRRDRAIAMQSQLAALLGLARPQFAPIHVR